MPGMHPVHVVARAATVPGWCRATPVPEDTHAPALSGRGISQLRPHQATAANSMVRIHSTAISTPHGECSSEVRSSATRHACRVCHLVTAGAAGLTWGVVNGRGAARPGLPLQARIPREQGQAGALHAEGPRGLRLHAESCSQSIQKHGATKSAAAAACAIDSTTAWVQHRHAHAAWACGFLPCAVPAVLCLLAAPVQRALPARPDSLCCGAVLRMAVPFGNGSTGHEVGRWRSNCAAAQGSLHSQHDTARAMGCVKPFLFAKATIGRHCAHKKASASRLPAGMWEPRQRGDACL